MGKIFHTQKSGRVVYPTGNCADCGVHVFSYATRCRKCAFKIRTTHQYYSACIECGVSKSRNFSKWCRPCADKSKYKNVLERLERYTDKTKTCWKWEGQNNGTGYGVMTLNGIPKYVHRVSYEFHFGPIPGKMNVLHKCDVRNCWRPEHLEIGTQMDNIQDAIKKGRHVYGEKQGQHKLTTQQVRLMKAAYIPGSFGSSRLAKIFGVSFATAQRIVHGKSWKHID